MSLPYVMTGWCWDFCCPNFVGSEDVCDDCGWTKDSHDLRVDFDKYRVVK